jgi:hypothetical protein
MRSRHEKCLGKRMSQGFFDPVLEATGAGANPDLRTAQAREVVADYGVFLENCAPAPGTVADEGDLPYAKEIIKWALQSVFGQTRHPAHRQTLKIGYLRLAAWQPKQGSTFVGLSHRGGANPLELAQRLAAEKAPEEKWLAASQAERSALVAELRQLGFW